MDNVYALFMRTYYDDLRRNDDDFDSPDITAAPPEPDAAPALHATKAEAYARDEIASRLLLQSRLPFPPIAGYTGLTDEEVRQLAVRIWKR